MEVSRADAGRFYDCLPYTAYADKCSTTGRLRAALFNLNQNIVTVDKVGISSKGDSREWFGLSLQRACLM